MSPPAAPLDVIVRLAAETGERPTLADLKALTLGHLEGGGGGLVLDLHAAGPLDHRTVGTLVYVLALYQAAGGRLRLCVTPEQRRALSPYASLFALTEDGDLTSRPPGDGAPLASAPEP